jgi:hypothetical protein
MGRTPRTPAHRAVSCAGPTVSEIMWQASIRSALVLNSLLITLAAILRIARSGGIRVNMVRKTDAFSDTFIEGLRRDLARWKTELSMLDVGEEIQGNYLQTSELRAWIEAGEAIFARYESRRG